MGQRIVYCEICGDRILEADLESGRAIIVGGRDYCAKCREKAPKAVIGGPVEHRSPPPPTTRRAVPAAGTSRTEHHRAGHATAYSSSHAIPARRSQAPLYTGLAIGAILMLLVSFAFLPGNPTPAPPTTVPTPSLSASPAPTPSVDPHRAARDSFRLLLDFVRERKDDPEAIIGRIEADLPRLAGSPFAEEARALLLENRRLRDRRILEHKVSGLLARVPAERDDLQYERRGEALECLREAMELTRDAADLAARVEEARNVYEQRFERAAEEAAGLLLDRARDLDREHKHQQCLEALAEFPPSFEGSEAARRIDEAKEEYRKSWEHCNEEKEREKALPPLYRDFTQFRRTLQGSRDREVWTRGADFFRQALISVADYELITRQGLGVGQRWEIEVMARYILTGYHANLQEPDKAFPHLEELLRLGGAQVFQNPLETDQFLSALRPDSRFKALFLKYEKRFSADRRWLGFFGPAVLQKEADTLRLPPDQGGLYAMRLVPNLAGAKAGFQQGDIVVGFAGKKLGRGSPGADLDALCEKTKPGVDYEVEILRAGVPLRLTVRW